jgi:hypothetical protein
LAAKQRREKKRERSRSGQPQASKVTSDRKRSAKSGLGEIDEGLLFVLRHPLRILMLVSLNEEGDGSPSDLAARLNVPVEHTAHHIKVLKRYKFVKEVRKVASGASTKTIYRAIRKVEFPKESWEALPPYVQNQVIFGLFLASFNDAESALLSGAYEERPESHASWMNFDLDERSWRRLIKLLDATFHKVIALQKSATDRKDEAERTGQPLRTVSISMSAFLLPGEGAINDQRVLRHEAKGVKRPSARSTRS